MLDKDGRAITHDKNGRHLSPIRHIRCKTSINDPITLKKQTYLSTKKHKQYYYTNNGENTYLAIYWDGIMGSNRSFEIRTLFDIANFRGFPEKALSPLDCFPPQKDNIKLFGIIRPGSKVIVFDKNELKNGEQITNIINKLYDAGKTALYNRLYTIRSFEKNGTTILTFHNEARNDKELGRGSSKISISSPNPKDRVSIIARYILIEGYHFNIDSIGNIHFIKQL